MATRIYTCLQSLGLGYPSFGPVGTVAASGVGTPPEGFDRLNDNRDTTYWLLSGTAAAPSGLFPAFSLGSFGGVYSNIPGNADVVDVNFILRASTGACSTAQLHMYVNGGGTPVGDAAIVSSSSFGQVTVPTNLVGSYANIFNQILGVAVDTDCDTGGPQEVNVAEATASVDFEVPTPTVTTLPPADVVPTSATVRGSVMVNQQQIEDGGEPNRFSTEFPLTAWFELGTTPSGLVQVGLDIGPLYGSFGGNLYNNTAVATLFFDAVVSALQPNTIYYFRFVAEHEDGTFRGDTLSFTTPLTDPVKGVY